MMLRGSRGFTATVGSTADPGVKSGLFFPQEPGNGERPERGCRYSWRTPPLTCAPAPPTGSRASSASAAAASALATGDRGDDADLFVAFERSVQAVARAHVLPVDV